MHTQVCLHTNLGKMFKQTHTHQTHTSDIKHTHTPDIKHTHHTHTITFIPAPLQREVPAPHRRPSLPHLSSLEVPKQPALILSSSLFITLSSSHPLFITLSSSHPLFLTLHHSLLLSSPSHIG